MPTKRCCRCIPNHHHHTYVQMLLRSHFHLVLILSESIVNHIIGALAVQHQLVVPPQNHRHSLAHIVEIQYAQQFVLFGTAAHLDRYRVGRSRAEHKTEIPGGRHQGRLVGTLGLILEPAVAYFRHYRVTDGEQSKEIVHVLIVGFDGLQQGMIVPTEFRLELRIEGEVERFGFLGTGWMCVYV